MSKLSSILAMSAILGALAGNDGPQRTDTSKVSGEKYPYHPKGLKRFNIEGREIWAINKKNAERKYRKLLKST